MTKRELRNEEVGWVITLSCQILGLSYTRLSEISGTGTGSILKIREGGQIRKQATIAIIVGIMWYRDRDWSKNIKAMHKRMLKRFNIDLEDELSKILADRGWK